MTSWLANYKTSASLAGAAGLHDALSQLVDTSQLDSAWHQRPLLSSADIGGEFLTLETLTAARPNLSQVVYWKATPPHHTASVAEIGMSEALALDGNLLFKAAGEYLPQAALLALAVLDVLELCSVTANVYVARGGQSVSRAPHTDAQAVFVLQTSGAKRWRVFAPPDATASPDAEPLERGKFDDVLLEARLGPPVMEALLTPGRLLFVPAGWPHATSTASLPASLDGESVHVTLGVEAVVDQLTYLDVGAGAIERAMLRRRFYPGFEKQQSSALDEWVAESVRAYASPRDDLDARERSARTAAYLTLLGTPAHVGYARRRHATDDDALAAFEAELLAAVRALEPDLADGMGDAELRRRLGAVTIMVASVVDDHAARLVALHRDFYRRVVESGADAAALSAAASDARAQRQQAVVELKQWYAQCGAWVRVGTPCLGADREAMDDECPGVCEEAAKHHDTALPEICPSWQKWLMMVFMIFSASVGLVRFALRFTGKARAPRDITARREGARREERRRGTKRQ